MRQICEDLAREHRILDEVVSGLGDEGWNTMTPSEGWTIKHQICHLAYFDQKARVSATDPQAFARHLEEFVKGINEYRKWFDELVGKMSPQEALKWWRDERSAMLEAFRGMDPKKKIPWYGPPMSVRTSATARLMETWAHGQDVFDALGLERPIYEGIRNICHLGVITFGWSYANRGMKVPEVPVRVELTGPSGGLWTWGPEDAENVVRGPAADFCLVVTQRRNVADTSIETEGPVASEWMSIAQAFAGPPTLGPQPGKRVPRTK